MFFGATSSAISARQLLPPHAVAQRDRDGALRLVLPDDVLVELGDDLPRRQRLDGGGGGFGEINGHARLTATSIVSDVVRVDADRGGDVHRLFRDAARVERRCAAPAPSRPPARTRRPIRSR